MNSQQKQSKAKSKSNRNRLGEAEQAHGRRATAQRGDTGPIEEFEKRFDFERGTSIIKPVIWISVFSELPPVFSNISIEKLEFMLDNSAAHFSQAMQDFPASAADEALEMWTEIEAGIAELRNVLRKFDPVREYLILTANPFCFVVRRRKLAPEVDRRMTGGRATKVEEYRGTYVLHPSFSGDYSDWSAVVEEMVYTARFCYNKEFKKLLREWQRWIIDNNDLVVMLTADELAELDSLIATATAAKLTASEFDCVPPQTVPIMMWMDAYTKSQFSQRRAG